MQQEFPKTILKEAIQLTDAVWAAWVTRETGGWRIDASQHLTKARRKTLVEYLSSTQVSTWISGALAGGRTRSRKLPASLDMEAARVYAFPVRETQSLLLVGAADSFDSNAQRIWRLAAASKAFSSPETNAELTYPLPIEGKIALPYDLPRSLERVLKRLLRYIPAMGAWLAVYHDNELHIEAYWNCPSCSQQALLSGKKEFFRAVYESGTPLASQRGDSHWEAFPQAFLPEQARAWIFLPLKIGRRVVGAFALWRETSFSEEEIARLEELVAHVTPSVDMFITFAEMADHLRRLAMLNDFALVVSSAQNLEQIVRRVFALLARAFGTELITLFLLSSDERTLREYRSSGGSVTNRTLFVETHPLAEHIRSGQHLRVEDVADSGFPSMYKTARTALLIPLKYRGKIIGALELESDQSSAFTAYDENLLVVIASHLAGLVDYGRLREEAETRARNLESIHEAIQQVIGLTNIHEVVQLVADLLTASFSYEVSIVMLLDRDTHVLAHGIGGEMAPVLEKTFSEWGTPFNGGVASYVFSTGKSLLLNDVSQSAIYKPIAGWTPGSELCVALKDGEYVLGILDVESREKNAFSYNDLMALESLAGFLTSVVSSVDRYQMLQEMVSKLQSAQIELQNRIKAQRAAESRLMQAAKLAAVGEMAAGIAHELNNPLTTVSGFAELLLEDIPEDSPQREDMELILREARRARGVVRRLLDFSRQSETIRVRADMNEVVEDVLSLTRHLFHTNGVQVHLALEENLPWVSMDRNQMKQVMLNLFHNAIHAMPDGGDLRITTRSRQRDNARWISVAIRDTGIGIPPENLDRIFEPFFTTKSSSQGTGLGLSVTYGIVSDHGGFIDLESEPGVGSCFTVWLPVEGDLP